MPFSIPSQVFSTTILLLLLLSFSPTSSSAQEDQQSTCTTATGSGPPAAGCQNGLWSQTTCQCECIPPFCHDYNGECVVPGGNCSGGRGPWVDCTVGVDCPWWKSLLTAESCTSGPVVPPGIWEIYASEEVCCDKHHPNSVTCSPVVISISSPPTERPSSVGGYEQGEEEGSEYELVLVKFSVGGLPEVVNVRELKAEMLIVLKRILIDLAERVQDLKIKHVEENLVLTVNSNENNNGGGGDAQEENGVNKHEVYYDVSVVRHANKKFGPIIIAGIRDSYDVIMDKIMDYANIEYIGHGGVDLTWCTDDNQDQLFSMCTRITETVSVEFRLENLPQGLDVEELIQQMIGIYQDVLMGVDGLDIIEIDHKVITPSSNDEEEGYSTDVYLDIVHSHKSDMSDSGRVINETLQVFKNDILNQIQSYTDNETDLDDLNWCMDEEAYAVCPIAIMDSESESRFALPNWAIITLTVVSVILTCCICWCTMSYIIQREESKNERNMMTYIHTGQNYSKPRNTAWQSGPPPTRQHQRQRLQQQRQRLQQQQRRPSTSDRSRPQSNRARERQRERPERRASRAMREPDEEDPPMQRNRPPPQQLMLTNGNNPQQKIPKKETEYQLENSPTFVFDNDDYSVIDNADQSPQQCLMLTNYSESQDDVNLNFRPDP